MKIFFAGSSIREIAQSYQKALTIDPEIPVRILMSCHYCKRIDLEEEIHTYFPGISVKVFLDSGAFSAKNQAIPISLDEYCRYINKYNKAIAQYANLDMIGNADKTLENQKEMEYQGFHPIPVFHTGESWKYLETYTEYYSYIALGGMVPHMRYAKTQLMSWLNKAFQMSQGKSLYHGFGCTN